MLNYTVFLWDVECKYDKVGCVKAGSDNIDWFRIPVASIIHVAYSL